MKKVIVCLTLAALALVPSAQAGEKKSKTVNVKNEAACAVKSEAACATQVKAESACSTKTACCASAKKIAKRDVKGATLLARR